MEKNIERHRRASWIGFAAFPTSIISSGFIKESQGRRDGAKEDITCPFERGFMVVPDGLGLGTNLDEQVVTEYLPKDAPLRM